MNQNNSTCAICGAGYYSCNNCKETKQLNPWRLHTDTPEHFKIFMIVRGYTNGIYSAPEARAMLERVDLSDLEELRENIKAIIKGILDTKASIKEPVQNTYKNSRKAKIRPEQTG